MPDIEGLLGRLTQGELEQLRTLRPDGFLPGSLTRAIDRAAGGPWEGRGYYVAAKPVVRREFIAYVLRPDVAKAVAAPTPSGSGTAAPGPAAAGARWNDESDPAALPSDAGARRRSRPGRSGARAGWIIFVLSWVGSRRRSTRLSGQNSHRPEPE
jgi:hypothetical protein